MPRAPWHLLSGEFPPQPGGVSDYVWTLAEGLARAGDEVHVCCPPVDAPTAAPRGVTVHREFGVRPRDLRRMGRLLDQERSGRRLLLQWVPHSFGYRSMNVGICLWLLSRRRQGDRVEVMVHEPGMPFSWGSPRQNLLAAAHRLMAAILLRAADHVWVSTPAWERRWRRWAFGRSVGFTWIPIPSSVPVVDDPAGAAAVRARYAGTGMKLVGHFGTYRPLVATLLRRMLLPVVEGGENVAVLLLGRGSESFREHILRDRPDFEGRIHATGGLPATDLSLAISACDLMLQPYPDGVNGRQSSMAAVLEHGRPAVTNVGDSTEPVWSESGAVAFVDPGGEGASGTVHDLLHDDAARERMGAAARRLYGSRFDPVRIIASLREDPR